jgi:hypothetical protein
MLWIVFGLDVVTLVSVAVIYITNSTIEYCEMILARASKNLLPEGDATEELVNESMAKIARMKPWRDRAIAIAFISLVIIMISLFF